MYGLTTDIVQMLQETSAILEDWTEESCINKTKRGMEEWGKDNGVIEETDSLSCDWYHSTWQYLRLLNMVAVPNWYYFYNEAIGEVLKDKPKANVFISACADYGMLAKLHEAIKAVNANPKITIYDICRTPLRSCEWYAQKTGLTITCKVGDIIESEIPEAPFDLIITDEFLSVLKDEYKPLIVEKWKKLLKPDGVLVTTAMIGKPTTPEVRKGYENRGRKLFTENKEMLFPFVKEEEEERILTRISRFAQLHTRHMIKDEKMLKRLFKGYKDLSYSIVITPGECVNPTPSFQIVASPGCNI